MCTQWSVHILKAYPSAICHKINAGNVELIKIINRLGHVVSHTLAEVDTAYAIQKISTNSGLIPEEIQPYQQTISGAGTIHRVNGIVIQKAFI